jgi:hypothetical protein
MKVSWDDYSQYMESHKINGPNHQPGIFWGMYIHTFLIFFGFWGDLRDLVILVCTELKNSPASRICQGIHSPPVGG